MITYYKELKDIIAVANPLLAHSAIPSAARRMHRSVVWIIWSKRP
jgi:hypothetical protein